MSFLPSNYTEAASSRSSYTKLEPGSTKIRILSDAVLGYQVWTEDAEGKAQCSRFKTVKAFKESGITLPDGKEPQVILAFKIWNYNNEAIELFAPYQTSIKSALEALNNNEDWGDPKGYNITIEKTGKGMETKYNVTPSPAKELDKEIAAASKAQPVALEQLFVKDGNPFKKGAEEEAEAPKASPKGADIPSGADHESEIKPEDLPF